MKKEYIEAYPTTAAIPKIDIIHIQHETPVILATTVTVTCTFIEIFFDEGVKR